MTGDPAEGTDSDGFLTTGVDIGHVKEPYGAVITDARDTLCAALSDDLHGLYIYGSVVTGQARPPGSDLDLAAIVRSRTAKDRCPELSRELSQRHHRVVSEVGVAAAVLTEVLSPDSAGRAERCFLKHYCVHVAGIDMRPELPRCQPDRVLARGFVGDLDGALAAFRRRFEPMGSETEVWALAAAMSRRLLLAAAVLYSAVEGIWTTDRAIGARLFADRYPDRSREAMLALSLSHRSWSSVEGVEGPVHGVGSGPAMESLFELGRVISRDVREHLSA